jgi:hypothetical protein
VNGPESAEKVANLREKLISMNVDRKRIMAEEGIENKRDGDGKQISRKKMKKLMRGKGMVKGGADGKGGGGNGGQEAKDVA